MKFLFIMLFYSLFLLDVTFAQSISSEFLPDKNISSFKEGDIIEATIRVWPIESADFSEFKKLEKTVLFNAFYLAQIIDLATSANNADVVELRGMFIIQSAKANPMHSFNYQGSIVDLKLGEIKIQKLNDQNQDFYILNQTLDSSQVWIVVTGAICVILVIVFLKRRWLKEFLTNLKPDQSKITKKRYDELFRTANKREDFELIYSEKEKWMAFLSELTPAHQEFLKTLNSHQFKKDWRNDEYNEVRAAFDVIRRSFEK